MVCLDPDNQAQRPAQGSKRIGKAPIRDHLRKCGEQLPPSPQEAERLFHGELRTHGKAQGQPRVLSRMVNASVHRGEIR